MGCLAPDFYKELLLMSMAAAVSNYPGPLRVVIALEETIVTPQPFTGEQPMIYHEGVEDLVSIASDQDFGALSSPDLVDADLIPNTVGWFQEYLWRGSFFRLSTTLDPGAHSGSARRLSRSYRCARCARRRKRRSAPHRSASGRPTRPAH